MSGAEIAVNGQTVPTNGYLQWHARRIALTGALLERLGSRRIVELGGHPWVMTGLLLDRPHVELCATVSVEEATLWPDDVGVTTSENVIRTPAGREHRVTNYAANLERRLFDLHVRPDTVIACEIVEHLIRAPHVMLLNVNRWLPVGGTLVITTPNGAQFSNPFRRTSGSPAYRHHVYERHAFLYAIDDLVDLVALCGFRITERALWDPYPRSGLSSLYGVLGRLPSRYLHEKFRKMIVVVAKKERDVTLLPRAPKVFDARGDWEYVARRQR